MLSLVSFACTSTSWSDVSTDFKAQYRKSCINEFLKQGLDSTGASGLDYCNCTYEVLDSRMDDKEMLTIYKIEVDFLKEYNLDEDSISEVSIQNLLPFYDAAMIKDPIGRKYISIRDNQTHIDGCYQQSFYHNYRY